jgi:hypothetical protein
MYDVFLICPVRNATEEQRAEMMEYIKELEDKGLKVYYPARDTDQNDGRGIRICRDNKEAIKNSREVHIYFVEGSQGSLFDLGMAFMADKPLKMVNKVTETPYKSFQNVLIDWEVGGTLKKKAILEFEYMPENCYECPLIQLHFNSKYSTCIPMARCFYASINRRHPECPLKPVEESNVDT